MRGLSDSSSRRDASAPAAAPPARADAAAPARAAGSGPARTAGSGPARTAGSDPARAHGLTPERTLAQTLRQAVERHGDRVVLLCSFQKEESVMVDELLAIGGGSTAVRIVTIDTGVLFPETLQTWRAFEQRFGIAVEALDASGPGGPWTGPEHCCSAAKVAALERVLAGAEAWITGIRREQGPTRSSTALVEEDSGRGILKYNPLAHWSETDIWRRIQERALPYHPLHDRGYDSIGCAPCTQPGRGRDGRWQGTEKTECGLHTPLPASGSGHDSVVSH